MDLNFTIPVALKGRAPAREYPDCLAGYFFLHEHAPLSTAETDAALFPLTKDFPGIDTQLIDRIFPLSGRNEDRPFARLPRVMGEAPREKLEFNLAYQDTRIKLAAEDKLGKEAETNRCRQDATTLMKTIAILLHTTGPECRSLWRSMTDNDLDALMYLVLGCYNPHQEEQWLHTGLETNRRAIDGIAGATGRIAWFDMEELIRYQVFAGTVWWTDTEPALDRQFEKIGRLAISDTGLFIPAVLRRDKAKLVFLFDDNGELVWDLWLIRRLLNENPTLAITGVINSMIIANNANSVTLQQCLGHPLFADLNRHGRFEIFEENNYRSAIDPLFCSAGLLDRIQSSDLAFIKGVSFFETIQGLSVDAYYAFVVHSHDSQLCTGLEKGDGVFVKVGKGQSGYRYLEKTLKDLYPTYVH